jgi:hypothetical protein
MTFGSPEGEDAPRRRGQRPGTPRRGHDLRFAGVSGSATTPGFGSLDCQNEPLPLGLPGSRETFWRWAKRPDLQRRGYDLRFAGVRSLLFADSLAVSTVATCSSPPVRRRERVRHGPGRSARAFCGRPGLRFAAGVDVARGMARSSKPTSALSSEPVRRDAEIAHTSTSPQLAAGFFGEVSRPTVCSADRNDGLVPPGRAGRTLPDLRLVGGSSGCG